MPYFDYDDPLSYGMDMPSSGGFTGQMDDGNSNLLRLIRLHNIFNPGATTGVDTGIGRTPDMLPINQTRSQPGGNAPVVPGGKDSVDSSNIGQNVMDLYHPSTRYEDRMDQLLNQMPVRNKPGIGRKIMASIAGLGGVGTADKVLYGPYYNQLADWKEQFDPVAKAAADETRDNANLRQIAIAAVNERHRDQVFEQLVKHQGVTEGQGQQRIDLGEDKFAYKQKHDLVVDDIRRQQALGGVFKVDADGTPRIYHKDGSSVPVDGRYLSADEINAYATQRATAIAGATAKARAENERHRVVSAERDDPDHPGSKIKGTLDLDTGQFTDATQAAPGAAPAKVINTPKAAVGSAESAANRKLDEADRAERYKAANPKLRNYIHVQKDGSVKIDEPGYIFGPNEKDYNDMVTKIHGTGTAAPSNFNKGQAQNPALSESNGPNAKRTGTGPANNTDQTKTTARKPPPAPAKRSKPPTPQSIYVWSNEHNVYGWAEPNDPGLKDGTLEQVK